MKKNRVTESDAYVSHDKVSVCGIVENVSHINWFPNDWALGCDFWKNSLDDARTSGAECSNRCASTLGSHFSLTLIFQSKHHCIFRLYALHMDCLQRWNVLDETKCG